MFGFSLPLQMVHSEHFLSWEGMKSDRLLLEYNPKLQVPTLITDDEVLSDSPLIILHLLGHYWHRTPDANALRNYCSSMIR